MISESTEQLQFFVLDIVTIVLTIALVVMGYFIYRLTQKIKQQQKLYDALENTVDRILQIESEGGIDGRGRTHKERQK